MSKPDRSAGAPVGVIGAGAWGTALAQTLAKAGHEVRLWALEHEVAKAINATHQNPLYLEGVPLDEKVRAAEDFHALEDCPTVLVVTPAQHMRATLESFRPHMAGGAALVLCSKGIERGTMKLMTEVLAETCPEAVPAVLSGPSFAIDVVWGLPTAVTLACADETRGRALLDEIGSPAFRPYLSGDLVGAEIGGSVKNVLAIAAGIVEGRGMGKSAHAALIARGFAEMTRLAVALGAKRETLAGLCGLGDLVLTCSSPQSRNMSCGQALGRGESLESILGQRRSVTEGVATAPAVVALARSRGVEMPICEAVDAIVTGGADVDETIAGLLARPFRDEGL